MLPIKIKDGVISIDVVKKRTLTPKQLAQFNRTKDIHGDAIAEKYLLSLLGMNKTRTRVSRIEVPQWPIDKLAVKPIGTVRGLFEQLLTNEEDILHIPSNKDIGHWVGVEIECYYPSEKECRESCDHDNDECYADFCPNEDQAHSIVRKALVKAGVTRASVKSDGSLDDEAGVGVEVTLLLNTKDGFGQLEKVCNILNDLNCFVNNKCGLHVHLDARNMSDSYAKLVSKRLGRALPVLKWIVHPSRQNNHYCKMMVGPFNKNRNDRRYAINPQAYFKHGTLEVRLHGGSTNAGKIKNWIELLRFIAATPIPKTLATFQDLIDLGTPEHLIEYADKRITRLNPEAWNKLIVKG